MGARGWAGLLVAMATSMPARAESTPEPWAKHPFAIGLAGSPWGSPTGLLGVTAEATPLPRLVAEGGIGVGLSPSPWRYAGSLRYRGFLATGNAWFIGAGASSGRIRRTASTYPEDPEYRELTAVWVDTFIGLEWYESPSLRLAFKLGVEILTNEQDSRCLASDQGPQRDQDVVVPCSPSSRGIPLLYPVFPFLSVTVSRPLGGFP
jgi:hypothetical protein